MSGDSPERGELIRLAAVVEVLIPIAERVDGARSPQCGTSASTCGSAIRRVVVPNRKGPVSRALRWS
jgi:hypothetical protein